MPVRCAACSEEFLGAVNRCWKCGAYVTLNLEAFQVPPVRRAPLVLRPQPSAPAEVIATAEAVDSSGAPPAMGRIGGPGLGRRRGNPFAIADNNAAVFIPAASEAMANEAAAEKGVWLGLAMGLVAWVLAFFFPPAAFVVAIVAIGLAIWGLASRRKALAGAVIVLCVLGFLVSGYQAAQWAYDLIAPEFSVPEYEEEEF